MLAWNVDNEKNLFIKQSYTTNKLIKNKTPLTGRNYSTLNPKIWFKGLINPISLYNKKGNLKQQQINNNMENINLENFFGFAEVERLCPITMEIPVLPFHLNGKTIYPVGTWKGVYFSEELKAVVKLGYQIRLIKGYEFSKANLFESYIKYFYDMKKIVQVLK